MWQMTNKPIGHLFRATRRCMLFYGHPWIAIGAIIRKRQIGAKFVLTFVTLIFDLWPWPFCMVIVLITPLNRRWNGGILDSLWCLSVHLSVRPSVCRQGFRNFLKKSIGSIHFIPGIYPYGVSLLTPIYFRVPSFIFGPLVAKYLAKNGVSGTFWKNYWLNSVFSWRIPICVAHDCKIEIFIEYFWMRWVVIRAGVYCPHLWAQLVVIGYCSWKFDDDTIKGTLSVERIVPVREITG